MHFAYADPPYPGTAKKYYGREKSFRGEVNHRRLIERLKTGGYDGWALSTSSKALRKLLPLCPKAARICPWVKTHHVSSKTFGLHNVWDAVIVVPGRYLRPGIPDALVATVARGGDSKLVGRKPLAFCAWLFKAMGMRPGDELDDLYPGSRVVSRAWRELSSPEGNPS